MRSMKKRILGINNMGDYSFIAESDDGYREYESSDLLIWLAQPHEESYEIKTLWVEDMPPVTQEEQEALDALWFFIKGETEKQRAAFDLLWDNEGTNINFLI